MTVLDVRTLKPTSNEVLLDRIRDDMSPDYQARIPEATKAGIQQTMKALQNSRQHQNDFIDALVNKVALTIMRGTSWTNPLAEFKTGLLEGGDTIEEIMVGLIKAKTYDPARDALEHELFGTEPIEVQSNFHRVNRRDKYKITINQPLLMSAFNRPQGLSKFAAQIMNAPGTSDQWDEFLLMCQLFAEYESNGGYFKVGIRDVAAENSTEADAKDALRKIRKMAGNLKFISTQYNAARMQISAQPDELVLFVSPDFNAALDVEALAGAFNIDKAKVPQRIIEIPQEQFGIDGAQALMTTKDFFVVADQLFETASQWNPASLSNNYWLHRWQVISASRFVPAILFTTKGGDEIIRVIAPVIGIQPITILDRNGDAPLTVDRGERYQLVSEAITDPADSVNAGVRWAVAGATSPRTYVSFTGVLHIGGDEGATTLKVTATSTWLDPDNLMRNGETTSRDFTVAGEVVLEAWPNVDNAALTGDDAQRKLTGITVKGVAVSPTFDPAVNAYTVTVDGGSATKADVKVTAVGIDAGDIVIKTSNNGKTITVEAASAAGDPVYTVTVS